MRFFSEEIRLSCTKQKNGARKEGVIGNFNKEIIFQ